MAAMSGTRCPHCGRAAMSLWRKSSLGPSRVVACQACGKKVAVHWVAFLAAIPALLGGFALLKSASVVLGVVAVVAGILLMGVLHTFLVPLARGDG